MAELFKVPFVFLVSAIVFCKMVIVCVADGVWCVSSGACLLMLVSQVLVIVL